MKTDELIFVVLEGENNSLMAVEDNIGLVVFGEDINEIRNDVVLKVDEYYDGEYKGDIRFIHV
ncbi:hypothetical protein [Parapedobacter lycopersici]|uniref:hypothetical protein n=1 Tax=Parapedobacter lycopersici TaxID=1864939 RepID=UPI00333E62AC